MFHAGGFLLFGLFQSRLCIKTCSNERTHEHTLRDRNQENRIESNKMTHIYKILLHLWRHTFFVHRFLVLHFKYLSQIHTYSYSCMMTTCLLQINFCWCFSFVSSSPFIGEGHSTVYTVCCFHITKIIQNFIDSVSIFYKVFYLIH